MAKNVLIAEDTPSWVGILSRGFNRLGIEPDVARSYHEAIKYAKSKHYDLCVLDSLEGDYVPLRELILSEHPDSRVVLFTGNPIEQGRADSNGIEAYNKPDDMAKILDLIK